MIVNDRTTTPSGSDGQVNPENSFYDVFDITGSTSYTPNEVDFDLLEGHLIDVGTANVPNVSIYNYDPSGTFSILGSLLTTSTVASPDSAPLSPAQTYAFSGFAPVSLAPGKYVIGLNNLGGPNYNLDVRIASSSRVNTGTSGYVDPGDSQVGLWSLDATPTSVPEPSSFLLGGIGVLGMSARALRRKWRG